MSRSPMPAQPVPSDFQPIQVDILELSAPLTDLPARKIPATDTPYRTALLMLTVFQQPVGRLWVALDQELTPGCSAARLATQIWDTHATAINALLIRNGLPPIAQLGREGIVPPDGIVPHCLAERHAVLAAAPFMSVVICTRNRTAMLSQNLPAVLDLDYPHFEVIVVNNAPSTADTEQWLHAHYANDSRVRYVREDRPGLSWASNAGLRHARGEIVAFTDDDVLPSRHWLTAVACGFQAAANVGCVTGYTMPAELETQAQYWFEQFGGFNKGRGFARMCFNLAEHRPVNNPLYPYIPGIFGAGANMAFRTDLLRRLGGFDVALGGGTPARGGGDIDAFFRVVMSGATLVYEPSALLMHYHRRHFADLQRQLDSYGTAFGAFLMKTILVRPSRVLDLVQRIPAAIPYVFSPRSPRNIHKTHDYPSDLTRGELWGMVQGTRAYFTSYRHAFAVSVQHPRSETVQA